MYALFFRLVLRHFDPESMHHAAVPVIRLLGLAPFRWIVHALTKPSRELQTEALGLQFTSPFGIAAGFDKDVKMVRGLAALGYGHVEVGTVTAVPQDGNPRPRLFRLVEDRAIINRMGFNNAGAAAAAQRLQRLHRKVPGLIVGANIGKSRIVEVEDATADYVTSARLVAPYADYLAVNVSSPNTPGLRGLQAAESLAPLLQAVKEAAGMTPVLVKIAPDLPDEDIAGIAQLAVREELAGIIATNTTIAREPLTAAASKVEAIGAGGLSGAPLYARSLEVLHVIRAAVPADFTVISVGGVETGEQVRERLDAGATLVQGYSAFIYEGPLWGRKINRSLARSA